jgi:hypothetical protein
MKQVGDHIDSIAKGSAEFMRWEYPYVFAHNLEQYLIWHRDTGEIVWCGEEGLLGTVGYQAAWSVAKELNGGNPYAATLPRIPY